MLSTLRSIECLSIGSNIDCHDLPGSPGPDLYPAKLDFKDTLRLQSNWFSETQWDEVSLSTHLIPLSISIYYFPFPGKPYSPNPNPIWGNKSAQVGDWSVENKYIGVKLEKENGVYLGWIKVRFIYSDIVVHEMGCKKIT
ncbi:MAG: hypothetical protein U5L72_05830 [Bacteroidales bacterium]|nr:hypothetical protein [Bacteroidales bacterium]